MTAQSDSTWLTQEAYDRLKDEHEWLTTTRRQEITKEIQEAREDGDLKENAGYHAAREEQGRIEARITEIEYTLKHSVVTEAPEADGTVVLGTVVTAKIGPREQKFLFASTELESQTDLRVFSPDSPLGQAIDGLKVGDKASYEAPNGSSIEVEVQNVETFRG
ncbi:transcription elongation factor GreA [Gulosibacter molinativorax]|uniref:Transcription elongation factor GreA n=1 Tax=Gulosibacter molinativorax TaxID=256821 RepID=A0ABT7C6K3_9MICO|nr:transcription elongation factor GreA [Gulosibacter molinativorax]MDJ1370809.1 transcription elongation factor GreA [Gulosibacter molinativorax]QUY62145.1 Transcription elongation factor GreA [Gulosibacter molinativorax]